MVKNKGKKLFSDSIQLEGHKAEINTGKFSHNGEYFCSAGNDQIINIWDVFDKKCRTNECKAMAKITIDPEKCKGCGLCKRNCPVGCISGEPGQTHCIDTEKCIKCGTCISKCPFHAIES